jgi:hypothetical protein
VSEATARRDKTVPRQSNHTGTVDPAAKSNDTMSGVGDAEPPPILRLLKADEHRHRLPRERAARSPFALPLSRAASVSVVRSETPGLDDQEESEPPGYP